MDCGKSFSFPRKETIMERWKREKAKDGEEWVGGQVGYLVLAALGSAINRNICVGASGQPTSFLSLVS
jgi:hypothetical protein